MDGLHRDIRYAARALVQTPGFTLAAILTLALGIGANVAMFSIVYGVLLRPLPYDQPDRLVIARAEVDYAGARRPVPVFVQWDQLKSWDRRLDGIASTTFYSNEVVALSGDNGSEVLDVAVVSSGFFQTVSGPLAAGRPLDPNDDGSAVVVISDRLARRLFGAADRAVGKELVLTRQVYSVAGVAKGTFQLPRANVDVWIPAGFKHALDPRCCGFQPIARLEPAATIERARTALHAMFASVPDSRGQRPVGVRTSVLTVSEALVSGVRSALLVLFASVSMVLVIACGNLINLLLARNTARTREIAVRRALGASAWRIVRELVVESAMLSTAGAICGALLASIGVAVLPRVAAGAIPRIDAIGIDRAALLFAAALAIAATILAGMTPALKAASGAGIPNQGSAGTATPRGTRHLQRAMCVVQVALAVMLLVGATLMGRSLVRLLGVDLGVSTDHVLTASVNLAFGERLADAEAIARIYRTIDRVRALPGVRAVGAGTSLPPSVSRMRVTLRRQGDAVDYQAAAVPATPGYFSALQMRLIKGRFFTESDDDGQPPVIILSEDTAARFFGEDDPIGRTLTMPMLRDGVQSSAAMTVVGVTANVKYAGLAAPPDDIVYRPFAQQPWRAPFLVVRTSGNPADFTNTLRRQIAAADQAIVVASVTTLDQLVADEAAQPQFGAMLLASFAALALGIAAIGLYGVVAYTVSRRTKEIGIRIALGAAPRDVLIMVLGDGVIVAVVGIVAGVAGALALGRVLAKLLYGIAPTDPISFVVAAAVLLGLTLVASYIPARRAARIEPIRALRTE